MRAQCAPYVRAQTFAAKRNVFSHARLHSIKNLCGCKGTTFFANMQEKSEKSPKKCTKEQCKMYNLCTKEEKAHPHGCALLEWTIVRRVNRKSREAVNHTSFVHRTFVHRTYPWCSASYASFSSFQRKARMVFLPFGASF